MTCHSHLPVDLPPPSQEEPMAQQEPFCLPVQNALQFVQFAGRGDVVVVVKVEQCEVLLEARLLDMVLHGTDDSTAQHITPTVLSGGPVP